MLESPHVRGTSRGTYRRSRHFGQKLGQLFGQKKKAGDPRPPTCNLVVGVTRFELVTSSVSVKRLRKQAGLRQEDMARELGVSRQTIIAVENDKYNPTLELAMKIARLLGLHVDEIFFLDD